tara:strand:- start:56 stop:3163 length:3108 start_codon:yes stop_codon:yes gene_type:complete
MRNLSLYAILLLFFFKSNSQTPLQTKVDSMLVDIDQTDFTTGILYDRTVPWASLYNFNEGYNISNKNHFEQALLEIHNASNNELFMDHNELQTLTTHDSIRNIIDVGILNVSFQKLNYNTDNEEDGGLRLEEQRFQKINNDKSAFIENHVFVLSPLKNNAKGTSIIFNFNEQFLFQNTLNKNIQTLIVDFGNGISHTIIDNGDIVRSQVYITYSSDGNKNIEATATMTDGSIKLTKSFIYTGGLATSPPTTNFVESFQGFESAYPFTGYELGDSPIKGKLEYRIFFRSNASTASLNKPIIIIDGFDPGDKRKIQDIDSNEDPDKHRSIDEMMEYIDDGGTPRKLIQGLTTKGYDVIIVNHPIYTSNGGIEVDGGADYIERNALTHVTLYQHINDLLAQNNSDEELVIFGPSMGGQISRYALAYMEANNIEHNTRLWVSVDSPHLGANIPIGLQTIVRQVMSDNVMAQDFVQNHLGSPAAKQQLIEQLSGWNNSNVHQLFLNGRTISQGFSETRGHPFYTKYYNNLFNNGLPGSNGYPQNTRRVALVNGSLQGVKNFDSPAIENIGSFVNDGQIALNVRAFQSLCAPWPFQNNCWDIHIGSLESYTMPSLGVNSKTSRYKNFFDDDAKFVFNNNSRGSMDNVAGGYFNGYSQLADPIDGTDPIGPSTLLGKLSDALGGANISVYTNVQVHSFIPTISSLGFSNPDFNWTQNLNRDLVCTNEIPFDNYFGPKNNQGHTSFTQSSIEWIYAELDEAPLSPTVYNDQASLNGPNIICVNDIVTYDFDICASSDVQEWQVSQSLEIISSDAQSITVSSINSNEAFNNEAWIKAVFNDHEINKELWIGRPDNPGDILGLDDVHFASFNNYSVGPAQGAEAYTWTLPEPFDPQNDILEYIDGTSDTWQMNPTNTITNNNVFSGNAGYEGDIIVRAQNSCGEGNFSLLEITQYNSGPCNTCLDPLEIVPYPNSANVSFKLDFREHGDGTFYIYIYDGNANIVYQGATTNIEKTVNTEDIPPGTYYLHIHKGDEVTYQQLYINR